MKKWTWLIIALCQKQFAKESTQAIPNTASADSLGGVKCCKWNNGRAGRGGKNQKTNKTINPQKTKPNKKPFRTSPTKTQTHSHMHSPQQNQTERKSKESSAPKKPNWTSNDPGKRTVPEKYLSSQQRRNNSLQSFLAHSLPLLSKRWSFSSEIYFYHTATYSPFTADPESLSASWYLTL